MTRERGPVIAAVFVAVVVSMVLIALTTIALI